jgi:hypothetical protein
MSIENLTQYFGAIEDARCSGKVGIHSAKTACGYAERAAAAVERPRRRCPTRAPAGGQHGAEVVWRRGVAG